MRLKQKSLAKKLLPIILQNGVVGDSGVGKFFVLYRQECKSYLILINVQGI